jgi:hypothetical protein
LSSSTSREHIWFSSARVRAVSEEDEVGAMIYAEDRVNLIPIVNYVYWKENLEEEEPRRRQGKEKKNREGRE